MKKIILFLIVIFGICCSSFCYSQIIWSTFLGGNQEDWPDGLKIDTLGNIYIAGWTNSANFPITPGAYNDSSFARTSFLTELDSTCSYLVFSTFIGHSWDNWTGSHLTIDKFGNYYLTGSAYRTYPITSNSYSMGCHGINDSSEIVYVTKLNPSGNALIYSTFLCYGWSNSIAIDSSFNSFITGETQSYYFPTTTGAYSTIYRDSINHTSEIFITKLNPNADSLIYSTFIGGTNSDNSIEIKIDDLGNAYIGGNTFSYDYPVTDNAYCKSHRGMIITKLSPAGDSLIYSSYFGDISCSESLSSVDLDLKNNLYITGIENGTEFPVTSGAYDTTKNAKPPNGSSDIIITKFNSTGDSLIFSTYLGGSHDNESNWIKLDKYNNVYIIGWTVSDDYPVTDSSVFKHVGTYPYIWNAILSKLNEYGNTLLYSTYLTGGNGDQGIAIDIDKKYIYACGQTYSDHFPITNNAFDTSYNGTGDVFVSKLGTNKGKPNIHSVNNIIYPDLICSTGNIDTTITIINSGNSNVNLTGLSFSGKDTNEFKIIQPTKFPVNIQPNDSIKITIRYTPSKIKGKKTTTLNLINNTPISPFLINLSAINGIDYTIDNSESDTIFINIGTICPGSGKDTTITIINKSSIGTTFQIENVDPQLQIMGIDKAEKKEGTVPLTNKKRKK